MTKIHFQKMSRFTFMFLLFLGFVLLKTEGICAQTQGTSTSQHFEENCCKDAFNQCAACKNVKYSRHICWRRLGFFEGDPVTLGCWKCIAQHCKSAAQNTKSSVKPTTTRLKVEMAIFPTKMRVGQKYTFVANASGGTKPYNYQWSGNNINTGTGKANSVSTRYAIPVSFRNVGTTIVTVHVIDDNKNVAQASVRVRVVP